MLTTLLSLIHLQAISPVPTTEAGCFQACYAYALSSPATYGSFIYGAGIGCWCKSTPVSGSALIVASTRVNGMIGTCAINSASESLLVLLDSHYTSEISWLNFNTLL